MNHTKESLLHLVEKMRVASESMYWISITPGVHAFIEFGGMVSKYIDLCARAAEQGVDFTQANVHSGTTLPMEEHDAEYLAEKFECIFGPTLRANPAARKVFLRVLGIVEPDDPQSRALRLRPDQEAR